MKCNYFEQGLCRSCIHIQTPLTQQLAKKSNLLKDLLTDFTVKNWLEPIQSTEQGFRNKAKMVVSGAAHQPLLGIISPSGNPVSLCDCSLYPADMQKLLHRLESFVRQAGIPPFNIEKNKGELKFILLTRSDLSGEYLLRFVLKSKKSLPRIQNNFKSLLAEYPQIKVVSVNIQPLRMAVLEGEEELFLTQVTRLEESFNHVPLFIRPKSFFQTNPHVAQKLYLTAKEWSSELEPTLIWDLFCGVGGFGLHCTSPNTKLVGIEIEPEAIQCAKLSAEMMGLSQVEFRALNSTDFALAQTSQDKPDLVIVNPPRRGIGKEICLSLNQLLPAAILYSSCNPHSLIEDLKEIHGYSIAKIQIFDMFPHTDHFEVLVLLLKVA